MNPTAATIFHWVTGVAALATLIAIAVAGINVPTELSAILYIIVGWVIPDPSKSLTKAE